MMVRFLGMLALAAACFADTPGALRGKLVQPVGKDPVVQAGTGTVALGADEDTWKVLRDERLNNADVELLGQAKDATHFAVSGTHTHPVFVHRDGKRLYVTYWCDVCYIRTFVPGKCWCCQKYTDLDLRENLDE